LYFFIYIKIFLFNHETKPVSLFKRIQNSQVKKKKLLYQEITMRLYINTENKRSRFLSFYIYIYIYILAVKLPTLKSKNLQCRSKILWRKNAGPMHIFIFNLGLNNTLCFLETLISLKIFNNLQFITHFLSIIYSIKSNKLDRFI
jgi:hypothetical protein